MGYYPYTIYIFGWDLGATPDKETLKKVFKNIDYVEYKYSKPEVSVKLHDWIEGDAGDGSFLYSIGEILEDNKSKFESDVSEYQHETLFIGMGLKMSFDTIKEWKEWVSEFEFVTEDPVLNVDYLIKKYGEPKMIHENSMS